LLVCGKDIAFQGDWAENLINCAEFVAPGGEDVTWYKVTDNGATLEGQDGVILCYCRSGEVVGDRIRDSGNFDEAVCETEIICLEFRGIRKELY